MRYGAQPMQEEEDELDLGFFEPGAFGSEEETQWDMAHSLQDTIIIDGTRPTVESDEEVNTPLRFTKSSVLKTEISGAVHSRFYQQQTLLYSCRCL